MKKNSNSDVPLKILQFLKKTDKPVLAHHIAKSIRARPQHVLYHLKSMVKTCVVLTQSEFGHTYYLLQPTFYMEDAETVLMELLMPWVKEFSKQIVVPDECDEEMVRLQSLEAYFQLFFNNLQKDWRKEKKV